MWRSLVLPVTIFALILITFGCSGGASTTLSSASGRASFSVRWPEQSRLIPFAANSISIRLVKDNSLVGQAVLTRPTGGGTASKHFDRLPTGNMTFQAEAYPSTDGTGIAQAKAQVVVTILANQTVSVPMTLASTIDRIEVTPANPTVPVNQTQNLAATAKNTAGEVVITATSTIEWKSNNATVASVDVTGKVRGVAVGTTTVEAKEKESGKVGTTTVFVTGSPTPPPTPTPTPSPTPSPGNVQRLDLTANDMVYDRVRDRFYLSRPSWVGAEGNSVAVLNPHTRVIEQSVFVGSEPNRMVISDNAQYLHVWLDGAAAVRRINLATMTPDLQFTLGDNLVMYDMEAVPGQPTAIAVSRRVPHISPGSAGTGIYDNGVLRPSVSASGNCIEVGANNAIYGYDNQSSAFGFYRMTIDATGVHYVDESGGVLYANQDMVYGDGRIYSTYGSVVDPTTRTLLGTLLARGAILPDGANDRVYVLSDSSGQTRIHAYDPDTFLEVGTILLPEYRGAAFRLHKWGTHGIAFCTIESQVWLISNAP